MCTPTHLFEIQVFRRQENGNMILKYGGQEDISYKVKIVENIDGGVCLHAHWGTKLAHNSPLSSILPVIHNSCNKTVVLKAFDFAHAQECGIFKFFYFKFLNSQDAKNFIRVYSFLAPATVEADEDLDVDKGGNAPAMGDEGEVLERNEADEIWEQVAHGNEEESTSTRAGEEEDSGEVLECNEAEVDNEQITTDEIWEQEAHGKKESTSTRAEEEDSGKEEDEQGSDEESDESESYNFQNTQEDHWAQKPMMPWGNNAY